MADTRTIFPDVEILNLPDSGDIFILLVIPQIYWLLRAFLRIIYCSVGRNVGITLKNKKEYRF
jgi:hypothetical protein